MGLTLVVLTLNFDVILQQDSTVYVHGFLFCFRAAAARCRTKKKIWTGNLERKAEEMQASNARLQVVCALCHIASEMHHKYS